MRKAKVSRTDKNEIHMKGITVMEAKQIICSEPLIPQYVHNHSQCEQKKRITCLSVKCRRQLH